MSRTSGFLVCCHFKFSHHMELKMFNSNSSPGFRINACIVVAAISLLCFTKASGIRPLDMEETWKYYPPGTFNNDLIPGRKHTPEVNYAAHAIPSPSIGRLFRSSATLDDEDLVTDIPLLPPNSAVDSPSRALSSLMDAVTLSGMGSHSTPEMAQRYPMDIGSHFPHSSIGMIPELSMDMVDVDGSEGLNISETLYRLPKTETPSLTKLITGATKPTFFQEKIVKPEMRKSNHSDVLASYRVVVPIYIPAIKSNLKVIEKRPKIEYTKETHVKMVPVEKEVTTVQRVIKAEPVEQDIITEFYTGPKVKSDGKRGEIRGGEKVIKTTVQKFV